MSARPHTHPIATSPANKEITPMNRRHGLTLRARLLLTAGLSAALLALALAAPAAAEFGMKEFDLQFTKKDGSLATQAGSHPYEMTTDFLLNYTGEFFIEEEEGEVFVFGEGNPDGEGKNLRIDQPVGLIGDPTAVPTCTSADFFDLGEGEPQPSCPAASAVGVMAANVLSPFAFYSSAVYSLEPPPGVAARIGFVVLSVPVIADIGLNDEQPYNVVVSVVNEPLPLKIFGSTVTLWGTPTDPVHDPLRGDCLATGLEAGGSAFLEPAYTSVGECPTNSEERPFLTLPSTCEEPLSTHWRMDSWQEPGKWVEGSLLTHDNAEPPNPQGFSGCKKLGFSPEFETEPTTNQAETGSGLEFHLHFDDEGLTNPDGLSESPTKKVVVTLPEGITINPSVGEGLGVCTPADLERETLHSEPGEGCPNSSKIGTLHAETPIVNEGVDGAVFLAQQDDPRTAEPGAENPFDSLIALYFVLKNENLGALVKLPVKVEPDPTTGRLVTTLDRVPQIPISDFDLHLREGQRAPLVTPATCGTYTTEAKMYPWSDPTNPRTVTSTFEITKGKDGGACPPGGLPPFNPRFEAGSVNNNAGSFSPFNMRLIREDGEQDMTKFSAILPPGELGSLAGVDKCPDSAIAAARAKTGSEEAASPSCPANSLIGHTLAGAGVGGALTYVKGYTYLGGPYHGDPLSVISITPALAGPFDAGTVVVRLALTLNPKTAEVEVDGAASDPIPHILKGIVLKVRDLRVYVDRPNFTLNPTSCDESSAKATLFGSYLNVFEPADDVPVGLSTRYQAANCLNLGFKPRLALSLRGGTRRGGHPGLEAIYTPRPGDANLKGLVVRLPRSAFLDQAHIRTICTRVQFAADNCPKAAQYGYIKAWTPLLDEPLQGPVWLRSSNHKLPDLVFDLRGLVDVEVATRLDSVGGGIRAKVEGAPDAPISKVILNMQGGRKGLIVNSRDLCRRPARASARFDGHNGRRLSGRSLMRAQCAKRTAKHAHRGKQARLARQSIVD